jgi:hypothetical protein
MAYRDRIPTGGGLDGLPGFHVIQPGNAHRTQFTSWDKGKTVFRIYPAFANGVELPWREDSRPSSFTPWIEAYKFVKMMGVVDKFTCFVDVVGKRDDNTYVGPIEKFSNSIIQAIKNNARALPQEWEWWVKGVNDTGRNIKIPRIETWAFVQGALYECGEKVFMDATRTRPEPQHPSLLCLTKSARMGIEALCNEEVPGYTGDPEDFNARYACGDFLSCAGGRLVQFVRNPGDRQNHVRPHYETTFLPNAAPIPAEMAAAEWKPWNNLVKLLTEDEQIGLLVAHFPPEPLDYAFKGTTWYEVLPQSVRGAFDRMMAQAAQPMPANAQGYVPAGQAYAQHAAVQPTPVQTAPVQTAPVQTAPVQPTPVQPTPVQPTPVQPVQPEHVAPQASTLPPPPNVANVGASPYGNASWGQPATTPAPVQPAAAPVPAQPNNQPAAPANQYAGANFGAVASTPAPPPPTEVHVPATEPAQPAAPPPAQPAVEQPGGDAAQSNIADARARLLSAQEKANQA